MKRDLEKGAPDGVQAKAEEVKREALVGDLVASVSAPTVAKGRHTSAVFPAKR